MLSVARQIPNTLTSLRILVALVFPFVEPRWWISLIVVALLTEYFDGWLSRRFGWMTALGQLLDPIADKLFFISVAVTMLLAGRLELVELLMLGVRDILVALASFIAVYTFQHRSLNELKPAPLGKLTTALQYASFLAVLLAPGIRVVLIAATFVAGILATVDYLTRKPIAA